MKRFRRTIQKYERGFLIGLVIVLLIIFVVVQDIKDWLAYSGRERPDETAGSFALLAGERVSVTFAQYDAAHRRYAVGSAFDGRERSIEASELWTHLVLLQAAKREGVTISDAELVGFLRRIWGARLEDVAQWRSDVSRMFRVAPSVYEECVREVLRAQRMRQLYRVSFETAPAVARADAASRFVEQGAETVRATWAVLDASAAMADARTELQAEPDAEKALRAFYDTDASVTSDLNHFRHPRRYAFELIYAMHARFRTEEDWARVKTLFQKTFPDLDERTDLQVETSEAESYMNIYVDRLLAQAGTKWENLPLPPELTKPGEGAGNPAPGGEKPAEGAGEPPKEGGAEAPKEGAGEPPKEGGGEPPKQPGVEGPKVAGPDPKPGGEPPAEGAAGRGAEDPLKRAAEEAERAGRIEDARRAEARRLVLPQARLEVQLRRAFEFLRNRAARDPDKSFRAWFEELRAHDDPQHPICSAEPGTGIIVYREVKDPISGDEMEKLQDGPDLFTHNFRQRIVSGEYEATKPTVGPGAETFGAEAHGRVIFRVTAFRQESRKEFADLTGPDKEYLTKELYLPVRARARVKERLDALKKEIDEGKIPSSRFPEEARSRGARVVENERIEASAGYQAPPAKARYWPAEYRRFWDRYFLRSQLDAVLRTDRDRKKYPAGAFLDVLVESRTGSQEPGAAYLVQVLERTPVTAEEMTEEGLQHALADRMGDLSRAEGDWWSREFAELRSRFDMKFSETMQRRIDDEAKRRPPGS